MDKIKNEALISSLPDVKGCPDKVLQVCKDVQSLYDLYKDNWFNVEGERVPIISATLQMSNIDYDEINIILLLQMDDVTEGSIFQQVGEGLTGKEAKAVYEYAKAAIGCTLSMYSVW